MSSRDRQSIIGFTEAELGFFLAILFALLYVLATVPARADDGAVVEMEQIPADSLLALRDSLARITEERDTVAAARERLAAEQRRLEERRLTLEDSLGEIRKKSNITPNCTEKGLATGPLFRVVILGRDAFLVEGRTVPLSGVRAHAAEALQAAHAAGCIHRINVGFAGDVQTEDYDAARLALTRVPLRLNSLGRVDP
jgi:hypothetical protein